MNMSFFGFDPTKPPSQTHNTNAPGFGPTPDPFAGLSSRDAADEAGDALDFDEDDGLGYELEESGDAFNTATFGASANMGTDFDFSGQANTFESEASKHNVSTFPQTSKPVATPAPAQSGYEKYRRAQQLQNLEPDANIWGLNPSQTGLHRENTGVPPSIATATKNMMTLDEVEAMMRLQPKKTPTASATDNGPEVAVDEPTNLQGWLPELDQGHQTSLPAGQPISHNNVSVTSRGPASGPSFVPTATAPLPQRSLEESRVSHTLQNFSVPTHDAHRRAPSGVSLAQVHHRGPSLNGQPVTRADQITQLTEEERAAFLRDEANRAKRNHKIHLLSKDNGLMTPYDKNFITRIQLQQLVTATGGADEEGPEAALAEDFYYQVHSQIYRPRSELGFPPNHFAQTYLSQLSWKGGSRRYPRGGETHMRRMEQQVQRAVEAAKARPKNKQLVVEGSLGKISFSNAKTPKPLLNIRRHEANEPITPNTDKSRPQDTVAGRKAVLRDIEKVYSSLMKIEDCERSQPPQPREESNGDAIQAFMDWRSYFTELNQNLWNDWKVLEPIDNGSSTPHPFMAMLSHPKGKKLVPRVFRQIDDQQRLTVLTIIVVQLDQLDVIRDVQPRGQTEVSLSVRHEVELFAQAVEPSLFAYIGDAALTIVIGLVGLVAERVNIRMVLQARVGVNLLTRLLSRAVLILQGNHANVEDAQQWTATYSRLFDRVEAYLPMVFQSPVSSNEDSYVWQFLAALGILAGADQQQRLVIAAKDRVMDTVNYAKKLPEEREKTTLNKVNLFMHAIGLDVDLLG